MLYAACRQYLIDKLKEAGIKTRPYTTRKALEKCMESHVGAVIFERETNTRNGSKKRFTDKEGARHKRRKIFDRDITFSVIIGEYTDDAAETIFERFLSLLDPGIYVDGNFVGMEFEGSDWVDTDDSILRAKVAVQTFITFHGGLYRDTNFASLRLCGIEIKEIEKSKRKEPVNGD